MPAVNHDPGQQAKPGSQELDSFDRLRDDPEFTGLVTRLESRMAEARAWYEVHKDDLSL